MLKINKARRLAAALACASLALGAPAAANAPSYAGYSLTISGEVPVICRATVTPLANGSKNGFVGQLNEFCNSGAGYAVYAEMSGANDEATILVDGQAVSASDGGAVLLSQSSHANIATRNLAVMNAAAGTTISLRIVPL